MPATLHARTSCWRPSTGTLAPPGCRGSRAHAVPSCHLRAYAVDGNGDGRTDVYDPADAIPTAAAYLCASGAATDVRKALFAHNHAGWYVDRVLAEAIIA